MDKLVVLRHPVVVIYVDGSYMNKSFKPRYGGSLSTIGLVNMTRAGAGVIFSDQDALNAWITVPQAKDPTIIYDSIRAELYAAVCAVFLIQSEYKMYSPFTLFQIKQDCRDAICLLNWTQKQAKTPSRMLIEHPEEMTHMRIIMPWSTMGRGSKDIQKYVDVLDAWWFWSRGVQVELLWIPAHTETPQELVLKVAKSIAGYDATHQQADWLGNKTADLWAKSACSVLAMSQAATKFSHYPLYCDGAVPPGSNPLPDHHVAVNNHSIKTTMSIQQYCKPIPSFVSSSSSVDLSSSLSCSSSSVDLSSSSSLYC